MRLVQQMVAAEKAREKQMYRRMFGGGGSEQ
jgi:hypothetical protein